MQPHTRSISGAHQAVLDSKLSLYAFRLLLPEVRARHFSYPDDFSRDDSAPHTLEAHA
jgi:hypothetical protein